MDLIFITARLACLLIGIYHGLVNGDYSKGSFFVLITLMAELSDTSHVF